jgi:hypothetical protein
MAKKNLKESIKAAEGWFKKQGSVNKSILYVIGTFIILAIVVLALEYSPTPREGGLPSLLGQEPSLSKLLSNESLLGEEPRLPHLLTWTKPKEETEPYATVESIMCGHIYRYNLQNITLGSTTCYKWEDTKTRECMCITPIE